MKSRDLGTGGWREWKNAYGYRIPRSVMNNDVTRTVLHGFALCKQGGCLSGCIPYHPCIMAPMYNTHCYFGLHFKKKKKKQKTEEVVTKEYRKNVMIWKHSKNDNSIISLEKGTWCIVYETISSSDGLFWRSASVKSWIRVCHPLHPAPRLLKEHYGLENWSQSARN